MIFKSKTLMTYIFDVKNPVMNMGCTRFPRSKDNLEQIQGVSSIRIGNCDVTNFGNAFGFTTSVIEVKSIVVYFFGYFCWTKYIKNHFQGPGTGKRAVF